MNRRNLIKRVLTGTFAGHPLAGLLAKQALAQTATDKVPIRTLFVYHPCGCTPDEFFPAAGSRVLPPQTAPLQGVYDNLVFMDGLGITGMVDLKNHASGAPKCLTGRIDSTPEAAIKNPSIDVLMGKEDWLNRAQLGITVPSLQLGIATSHPLVEGHAISYDEGDQKIVPEHNTVSAFQRLFGGGSGIDDTNLLAAAKEDLARIQSVIGNEQGQRERLEKHVNAIAELEYQMLNGGAALLDKGCPLPNLLAANQKNDSSSDPADWADKAFLSVASDLQQDLAIAAFACGLTRAITLNYGTPAGQEVVPGSAIANHLASHSIPEIYTLSKRWYMQEIATLISKMAAIPEGTGSMLDNTIVVVVSELGESTLHSFTRIPMFLASGVNNNVGLVTGRSLDWRQSADRASFVMVSSSRVDNSPIPVVSHCDVLESVRRVAGYTSFEMPQHAGGIPSAWAGGNNPRSA